MSANWKERPEGGGRFAIWLIRAIAQYGGRVLSRLLLFPITLYFLIVRGPERRASRAYLSRVLGRPASLWEVARHIHCFASTILDRVFLLSGQFRRFDIQVHGLDMLHEQMDKGRGVLLFRSLPLVGHPRRCAVHRDFVLESCWHGVAFPHRFELESTNHALRKPIENITRIRGADAVSGPAGTGG